MSSQTLTITLPTPLARRVQRAAELTLSLRGRHHRQLASCVAQPVAQSADRFS